MHYICAKGGIYETKQSIVCAEHNHICNTGSYDMYPDFYIRPMDNSIYFTIKYDNQEHYKYIYELNAKSYVNIDGRHGLVLSGNTLAEEVYIYKRDINSGTEQRKPMFGAVDRVNQGIMAIPPGNAESLKCFVLSKEDVKLTAGDDNKELFWQIIDFKINELSDDCILAMYKVIKHNEPNENKKYSLRSTIWKYIDGKWKMFFHQGTYTSKFDI